MEGGGRWYYCRGEGRLDEGQREDFEWGREVLGEGRRAGVRVGEGGGGGGEIGGGERWYN